MPKSTRFVIPASYFVIPRAVLANHGAGKRLLSDPGDGHRAEGVLHTLQKETVIEGKRSMLLKEAAQHHNAREGHAKDVPPTMQKRAAAARHSQ